MRQEKVTEEHRRRVSYTLDHPVFVHWKNHDRGTPLRFQIDGVVVVHPRYGDPEAGIVSYRVKKNGERMYVSGLTNSDLRWAAKGNEDALATINVLKAQAIAYYRKDFKAEP